MSDPAIDSFRQVLLDEGPDGYVLVESSMTRGGGPRDKDKTKFHALVESENLSDELERLRDRQEADMDERRAADPGDDR